MIQRIQPDCGAIMALHITNLLDFNFNCRVRLQSLCRRWASYQVRQTQPNL